MAKIRLERDPAAYLARLKGRLPNQRRILGVDLGTNCGIAWADYSQDVPIDATPIIAGQWSLGLVDYESSPLRLVRLKQFLCALQPDAIGYEQVRFTPDNAGFAGKGVGMIVARVASSAELLGSFKAILTTWAEERGVPAQSHPIGTIKKWATGKGSANKEQMIDSANERFGVDLDPSDYKSTGADNIADAMFICAMTMESLTPGLF